MGKGSSNQKTYARLAGKNEIVFKESNRFPVVEGEYPKVRAGKNTKARSRSASSNPLRNLGFILLPLDIC